MSYLSPGAFRTRGSFATVATLLAVLGTMSASAQPTEADREAALPDSVESRDEEGRVVIRAMRVTEPLRIDGTLDEAVYSRVPPITGFIQQVPDNGAPVTEKTEMWVLFDDDNIYISCRLWDSQPERIVGNDMRRDSNNLNQQDRCDFQLDTLHDKRSGYLFTVTPLGGMRDGASLDEVPNFDWNAVWAARATRSDKGWITESAVPLKSLRYQSGRVQTWGIQLRRIIRSKNEAAFITPMSAAGGNVAINRMSEAATLVGIEVPPAGRNLDIKPYAISRVTTDLLSTPNTRNDFDPDGGIDVKYGVTKSMTASFTYRTDFAEAEADDAQVNLTRFSLFFPEKREFFLEGQGLFDFAGGGGSENGLAPRLFYSRRIGLNGSRVVPVIGGARVAGRAGAWSVGALNMETDDDRAASVSKTNFTVLRLRRDLFRRSSIGGMLTHRSASVTAPGSNSVIGLDASFAFFRNAYLNGSFAKSRTNGSEGNDYTYRAEFNYTADRYGLSLDRNVVAQNFNPELGFLRRGDFRRNYAQVRFSPRTKDNPLIRRYSYEANLDYVTDNNNRLTTRLPVAKFTAELHNSDSFSFTYGGDYEFLAQPFRISPGVVLPVGGYSFQSAILSYSAGQQRSVSGTASTEVGSFYNGDKKTVTFRGRASLMPQLSFEPNISLNWVNLDQGDFSSTVIGATTVWSMTPQRFISALVQYSSSSSSVSANVRFRWEYRPGSEMFVVYTEGRSTLSGLDNTLQNRGIVVKINRLFRL